MYLHTGSVTHEQAESPHNRFRNVIYPLFVCLFVIQQHSSLSLSPLARVLHLIVLHRILINEIVDYYYCGCGVHLPMRVL